MKIGIITGGSTGEREISIKSAKNICNAIDFAEIETFIFPDDIDNFFNVRKNLDVVIPVIHGVGAEDGSLQVFLETLGIPYIFSGIQAHSIGIDKRKTKEIVSKLGIKVPREIDTFPLFAKPNLGGSSVGSKLCNDKEELDKLFGENVGIDFILEESIKGREMTVGVVEKDGKNLILPVIEIIPKGEFFDFESKYDPEKLAEEICPAKIDADIYKELQRQALVCHQTIGAKHISRSDFFVTEDNEIYFLEINTIPGMTDTSLLPKMLKEERVELKNLLKEWVSGV